METLDINELIEDLMQDEEFKYSCDDESASFALTLWLTDSAGVLKWNY